MSKDKEDRDVLVRALPKEDRAEVESNSTEGMMFLQKEFGTASKATFVPSNAINPLFAKMVDSKLTFSFKVRA